MAVGMRNWKSEAGTSFTHKADGAVRAPAVGAIRLGPSGLAVEAELLKRRSLSLPCSLSPGPLQRLPTREAIRANCGGGWLPFKIETISKSG